MVNRMVNKMVCLEGIIGSGKTTQISLLFSHLSPDAVLIPELNKFSPLKETIQKWKSRVLSTNGKVAFCKSDIIDLARARSAVQKKLIDSLPPKAYILADRSVYTSLVYESGELGCDEIAEINRGEGMLFPDFGFVLDCEPEEALRRADIRRNAEGIYLSRSIHETVEEMQKRRQLYLELLEKHPELCYINANRPVDEVFEELFSHVKK
jgi:dTMP kinase